MKCNYCSTEVDDDTTVCSSCNYPLQGDKDTQRQFLYLKLVGMKAELEDSLEWVCKSKYIMFIAALLTGLNALMMFFNTHENNLRIAIGIVCLFFAVVLVFLGLRIEKNPITYSIIGLVVTFISIGGGLLGWASLIAMIVCVYFAIIYQHKKKQTTTLQIKIDKFTMR